jgi:hypothetical protein
MRGWINYADLAEGRIPNVLETFPVEWLTEMVKEWAKRNITIDILKVLRAMRNDESAWWLSILPETIPYHMNRGDHYNWLAHVIGKDNTVWGQFYRLVCSPNEPHGTTFANLVNVGFSRAIRPRIHQLVDKDEQTRLLQIGVSAYDPDSMYYTYLQTKNKSLLLQAAKLCHFESMFCLGWYARYWFMSGNPRFMFGVLTSHLNNILTNRYTKSDLQTIYRCGRELKGYEHIWTENRADPTVSRCVQIFMTITCNAVRSIRTFLLCADRRNRDIWRMVARRCYFDICRDVELWWFHYG